MLSENKLKTSSEVLLSEARLRSALASLQERGVTQTRRAALDAAAVVIERCCEEFDRRGDKNPGWLFRAVADGSVWFRDAASGAGRRLSASELLVWIDEAERQPAEAAA